MLHPPFPVSSIIPSGYKVMARVLDFLERPQEKGNILRPKYQQADFMLHIGISVFVRDCRTALKSSRFPDSRAPMTFSQITIVGN